MKLKATGMNIFADDGRWMLKVGDAAFETTEEARDFANHIANAYNTSWQSTELSKSEVKK